VRPVLGTTPSRTRPCFNFRVAKSVAHSILELFLHFKYCFLVGYSAYPCISRIYWSWISFALYYKTEPRIILAHRKNSDRKEDLIGSSTLQFMKSINSFTSALSLFTAQSSIFFGKRQKSYAWFPGD
jgi:hypothetical protein